MPNPNRVSGQPSRLFPPGVFLKKIDLAIAIHITAPNTMSEPLPISFRCDRVKGPGRSRILPVGGGVTDISAGTAKNVGLAIAIDVRKPRRLVVNNIKNNMLLPMSFAALGVFIPGGLFSRKAVNQNISPAVAIEIIGEHEEAFRIGVVCTQTAFKAGNCFFSAIYLLTFESGIGGGILVPLFEVRPFVPKGTRHNIHFPIVIEITEVSSLGPELIGKLDFFES